MPFLLLRLFTSSPTKLYLEPYADMSGVSFSRGLFWKNVKKCGKTAVFAGGYGRIVEIPD